MGTSVGFSSNPCPSTQTPALVGWQVQTWYFESSTIHLHQPVLHHHHVFPQFMNHSISPLLFLYHIAVYYSGTQLTGSQGTRQAWCSLYSFNIPSEWLNSWKHLCVSAITVTLRPLFTTVYTFDIHGAVIFHSYLIAYALTVPHRHYCFHRSLSVSIYKGCLSCNSIGLWGIILGIAFWIIPVTQCCKELHSKLAVF